MKLARFHKDRGDEVLFVYGCRGGKSLFDIIRFKRGRNHDKVIFILKKASELDPDDPEPDLIIGQIYMYYKRYRDLAMEHWQKAYNKTKSSHERQKIKDLMAGKKQ